MAEETEFSLADLSGIDISDIEEIRFEQLYGGIYDFKCVSSELGEGKNRDDEKIFFWEGKFEVLEMLAATEPNVDLEKQKGRVHTERKTIEPADAETGIGRIRAFLTDAGVDSTGKLGEAVGRLKGHELPRAKIVKRKNKDDPSIEYANIQLERKK